MFKIYRSLDQVNKCRELIGDHTTPVDELVRPPGQKKYLWEARVLRIRKHEERAAYLLEDGLIKYKNRKK